MWTPSVEVVVGRGGGLIGPEQVENLVFDQSMRRFERQTCQQRLGFAARPVSSTRDPFRASHFKTAEQKDLDV
jgi:hypothetical protein